MFKHTTLALLASLPLICSAQADFEIKGSQTVSVQTGFKQSQTVSVMKFNLSPHAKKQLATRLKARPSTSHHDDTLPPAVDLGMNNAPVLNQGHHGSCVTFANTGALNAALGKGDHISQLCNLALGKRFEQDGFMMSGWNGSFGPMVLSQLTNFGFISKENQKQYGCGGLKDYPLRTSEDAVKPMTLKTFHKHSENLSAQVAWSSIITAYDWLGGEYCPEGFLYRVKRSLADGHRVTFGTLLDIEVGHVGATGHYRSSEHFDLWKMTPEIKKHLEEGRIDAGHELVIYGYDDNAEVDGQKGILLIRNSWSEDAGYHGDYFMTYDYFKLLAYEGQKIMLSNGKMPPPGQ